MLSMFSLPEQKLGYAQLMSAKVSKVYDNFSVSRITGANIGIANSGVEKCNIRSDNSIVL